MIPWTKIVGVGLIAYAFYLIYKGEVDFTDKRRYNAPKMIYTRKERPEVFWGVVGIILIAGDILFFLDF
jgi:hypothetical protein